MSLIFWALITLAIIVCLLAIGEEADGRGEVPIGDGEGASFWDIGIFDKPVHTAFAPGERGTVYVVEQFGTVQAVEYGDTRQSGPFLDISNRTNEHGEQGLLSIAFHPGYEKNRLLYAFYTDARTGDLMLSEFRNDYRVFGPIEATHRLVMRIRHRRHENHNGGTIAFGPDGYLYIGTGDGGGAGDPQGNAQDRRSLLGKILRIDPRGRKPGEYRIPEGNPFRKKGGKGKSGRPEIYAVGLRNPYRFSFDVDGQIFIADVGQNRREEINYESPRTLRNANFGWNRFEGDRRFRNKSVRIAKTPKPAAHDRPYLAYGHRQGCSIVGGVVSHRTTSEDLYRRYVYADYCSGFRSFIPTPAGPVDDKPLGVNTAIELPTSITRDPMTEALVMTTHSGRVWVNGIH